MGTRVELIQLQGFAFFFSPSSLFFLLTGLFLDLSKLRRQRSGRANWQKKNIGKLDRNLVSEFIKHCLLPALKLCGLFFSHDDSLTYIQPLSVDVSFLLHSLGAFVKNHPVIVPFSPATSEVLVISKVRGQSEGILSSCL